MSTETQSNNQKKPQRDLEKGALWLKKSKAGADFLSGYITDSSNNKVNVVVFKNGYKKPGESSPDYRIYLSDNQGQSTSSPASGNQQRTKTEQKMQEDSSDNTDDIPF
jgi:uncharacterized protein (DUF736 family)